MDVVKIAGITMPALVGRSFKELVADCLDSISVGLKPVDGYKPATAIRTELRKKIKRPSIRGKIMTTEEFDTLGADEFEPPLDVLTIRSNRNPEDIVYTIPNNANRDPRISGRIIKIGPKAQINPAVLHYLVYNAGNYGFIHYGPVDPTVWYWRGDLDPYVYSPEEVVYTFSGELSYLLYT